MRRLSANKLIVLGLLLWSYYWLAAPCFAQNKNPAGVKTVSQKQQDAAFEKELDQLLQDYYNTGGVNITSVNAFIAKAELRKSQFYVVKGLLLKSKHYVGRADADSLTYFVKIANQKATELSNEHLLGLVDHLYASHLTTIGDYNNAIRVGFSALAHFQKAKDILNVAKIYNLIGLSIGYSGERRETVHYYNKAIDIQRRNNYYMDLFSTYNNMACIYLYAPMLDSARYFVNLADALPKKSISKILLLNFEDTKANLLIEEGKLAEAQAKLKSIRKQKMADPITEHIHINSMKQEGKIYLAQKNYRRAIDVFLDAHIKAKQAKLIDEEIELERLLADCYHKLRELEKAYEFLQLYVQNVSDKNDIRRRDSISYVDTRQRMEAARMEIFKKEAKLKTLEQDMEESETIQTLTISLALLATAAFILAFFLYNNARHSRNLLASHSQNIEIKNAELEELNKTKDRLFSIISHDLRGPLGALQTMPEVLQYLIETDQKQEIEKLLIAMNSSTYNLNYLLDSLLQWASTQSGNIKPKPALLNLQRELKKVADLYEQAVKAKNIKLVINCPSNIGIYVDSNLLFTILRNLVHNSTKFSYSGNTITLRGWQNGNNTLLQVQDSGKGMSQKRLETLFDNERKGAAGTAGEKGTGVGMLLVRDMVNSCYGRMTIESGEGFGTVVTLVLPGNESVMLEPIAPTLIYREPATTLELEHTTEARSI